MIKAPLRTLLFISMVCLFSWVGTWPWLMVGSPLWTPTFAQNRVKWRAYRIESIEQAESTIEEEKKAPCSLLHFVFSLK
jgi:hypothetical protein